MHPTVKDISSNGTDTHNFYSGQWWRKFHLPSSEFKDTSDGLQIPLGGEISTASNKSQPGALPLIDSSRSFKVEFQVKLSSNDPDHWPAVWIMPIEHNGAHTDQYPGRPKDYEKWVEIDVDEGGFAKTGTHGVIINWEGKWPGYQRTRIYGPGTSAIPLDRTAWHTFGFSYVANRHKARWWLDGIATPEYDVDWMPSHHYYIIAGAGSHVKNIPYYMYIRNITLYSSRNPA
ncbi:MULTISPECIES: hypothetical protein [unclassified Novosphingobium]|uniref:hypothetical protein n=1 Tax=unclassified Novosphingobium TaxID=2644732 RepID=UPI00145BFD8F|nr:MULTISPECIES: hypothetical protein [unclassified Novosphingobium]MBB3356215.1 hypothetical protein [Novosphingobium sp. BK256]MBB3372616.1 hypothetical protein [Novosphingobium sp. BK280]MBB3376982.1 hypothetical protein [Novosphingobium sp. BK258]MBB3419605.1 hypothetical protein [Novosphingobium sp. BK267]MBB3448578.1 hypothetical protein [Novosphingobium sp. BK352]